MPGVGGRLYSALGEWWGWGKLSSTHWLVASLFEAASSNVDSVAGSLLQNKHFITINIVITEHLQASGLLSLV